MLDLTREECGVLLRAGTGGRIALTTPDGPHIVPVVYVVVGAAFVVPAAPYSLVSTYGRDAVVALEVDGDSDDDPGSGWSVTARGRASPVDDASTLARVRALWTGTTAAGARTTYLRVRWVSLSGRRLDPPTAPPPRGPSTLTVAASRGRRPGRCLSPDPIRVYLLDDHEVVRQGLRVVLESAGDIEVVGESGSAVDATNRIPALRPHVAVLDGRLPDGSGVEVCRAVRSVDPSIKALILTSYDDDEALFAAIMAGAAGYLLKEIRSADLLGAVRQVAAGKSLIDPSLTARVLDRLRNPSVTAPELSSLTERELALLALIAEGLTNRQIGARMHLAEKTVKNYVSSILAKLGLQRRTQAAVLASRLLGPETSGTSQDHRAVGADQRH